MQLIEDHVKKVEKDELEEARSRSAARSVSNLFTHKKESKASRNYVNAKSRTLVPKQTDMFENSTTPKRNAQIMEAYQNSHFEKQPA